ncbi:MAG TPA: SDR family oxidoreductase [Candidatus Eisenbacteria bacterium]|nr:SDR family oxidoreductase [Candidatus Eisenbacteria bacterium]
MALLDGRVAIVTGAGRGIGREEALLLARHGAKVVVNDLGGGHDGAGADAGPAAQVVAEIKAAGGQAVANTESVSDWKAAARMVKQAIDTFGALHVVVNNAGILRDRMIFNMDESDVDSVLGVHLKGTFALTRHACVYWREQHKGGKNLHGRVVNTSSDSGLLGNAGQTNYGAAKAGIAALTVIAAKEMAKYGVTVNAVAPSAVTRMTVDALGRGHVEDVPQKVIDASGPAHVAPLVAWLASEKAGNVNGEVFRAGNGQVHLFRGWHTVAKVGDRKHAVWDPAELGAAMDATFFKNPPPKQTMEDLMKEMAAGQS